MTLEEFINTAAERGYITNIYRALDWAKHTGKAAFTEDDLIDLYRAANHWYFSFSFVPSEPEFYEYWDYIDYLRNR